jgi:hypothetical protein
MGLDTKTYWLTARQSQCDFHFDFWIPQQKLLLHFRRSILQNSLLPADVNGAETPDSPYWRNSLSDNSASNESQELQHH